MATEKEKRTKISTDPLTKEEIIAIRKYFEKNNKYQELFFFDCLLNTGLDALQLMQLDFADIKKTTEKPAKYFVTRKVWIIPQMRKIVFNRRISQDLDRIIAEYKSLGIPIEGKVFKTIFTGARLRVNDMYYLVMQKVKMDAAAKALGIEKNIAVSARNTWISFILSSLIDLIRKEDGTPNDNITSVKIPKENLREALKSIAF
jgi:integrase